MTDSDASERARLSRPVIVAAVEGQRPFSQFLFDPMGRGNRPRRRPTSDARRCKLLNQSPRSTHMLDRRACLPDGHAQDESIAKSRVAQKDTAVSLNRFEQPPIGIVVGTMPKAHQVQRWRRRQFKSRIGPDPIGELTSAIDVRANAPLQFFHSE